MERQKQFSHMMHGKETDISTPPQQGPRRGFLCSCRADRRAALRLQLHLAGCHHTHALDLWDETRIPAGALWKSEVAAALAPASYAVLRVSPEFLAAPFIVSYYLPHFLNAARADGTRIISVITRPCLFEESLLALQ